MADAFYTPTSDDEVFLATGHAEGPWDPSAQHGGPPSALLARAIERVPGSIPQGSQVTRLSVDILGPVPLAEIRVGARVARPGRSVELIEAELGAPGRPAMRARAWRIRSDALDLPEPMTPAAAPPRTNPVEPTGAGFQEAIMRTGFLRAMDWVFIDGGFGHAASTVWARPRVAVVDGEQPSPLQRLMLLADCGNGLSGRFDFAAWWFINVDLTVHLHRLPVGEWMCAIAASNVDSSGVGLAETELFDETGRVGRGAQSLLVGRR